MHRARARGFGGPTHPNLHGLRGGFDDSLKVKKEKK